MRYKVLWIDDEHEQLTFMKLIAAQRGIDFVCESNIEDGLATLEKLGEEVCGIVLDIRCPLNGSMIGNTAENIADNPDNTTNVTTALARITGIKGAKRLEHIPIFLYSGAGAEYLNKMKADWQHEGIRAYDKSDAEGSITMLNDIMQSIENQPTNVLKKRHRNIFECAFLEEETRQLLTELRSGNSLNTLRCIAETAFAKIAHRMGLLKEDEQLDRLTINRSCQEIRNCDTDAVPAFVGEACSYVTHICNRASHNTDYADVRYLYDSVLQALLVVLNWAATELRTEWQVTEISQKIVAQRTNRPSIEWGEITKPEQLKGRYLQLKGNFWGDAHYKLRPRKDFEVSNGMVIEIIDAQWDRDSFDDVFFINSYRIVERE